jgi:hypothetical protein
VTAPMRWERSAPDYRARSPSFRPALFGPSRYGACSTYRAQAEGRPEDGVQHQRQRREFNWWKPTPQQQARDRTHASRAPAPPRAPRAASCVSVRTEHNPDNAWRAVFSRITLITCGPPAHRCTADAPMAQPRSHRYVAPCRPTARCAGVRGQQAPAQLHSSRPTPSPRSVS